MTRAEPKGVKRAWEAAPEGLLTVLCACLLFMLNASGTVGKAPHGGDKGKGKSGKGPFPRNKAYVFKGNCRKCGKWGHKEVDCPGHRYMRVLLRS